MAAGRALSSTLGDRSRTTASRVQQQRTCGVSEWCWQPTAAGRPSACVTSRGDAAARCCGLARWQHARAGTVLPSAGCKAAVDSVAVAAPAGDTIQHQPGGNARLRLHAKAASVRARDFIAQPSGEGIRQAASHTARAAGQARRSADVRSTRRAFSQFARRFLDAHRGFLVRTAASWFTPWHASIIRPQTVHKAIRITRGAVWGLPAGRIGGRAVWIQGRAVTHRCWYRRRSWWPRASGRPGGFSTRDRGG